MSRAGAVSHPAPTSFLLRQSTKIFCFFAFEKVVFSLFVDVKQKNLCDSSTQNKISGFNKKETQWNNVNECDEIHNDQSTMFKRNDNVKIRLHTTRQSSRNTRVFRTKENSINRDRFWQNFSWNSHARTLSRQFGWSIRFISFDILLFDRWNSSFGQFWSNVSFVYRFVFFSRNFNSKFISIRFSAFVSRRTKEKISKMINVFFSFFV